MTFHIHQINKLLKQLTIPECATCWQGCGGTGTFMLGWWKRKLVLPLWITVSNTWRKVNTNATRIPVVVLCHSWAQMYTNAHFNIICNVKNIETICPSTRQGKIIYVHLYNEILYSQNEYSSCASNNRKKFTYNASFKRLCTVVCLFL